MVDIFHTSKYFPESNVNVNNILHRQAQWDSEGAAVLHVAGGARSDRQAEEPLCSRDQWQRTYSPGKFLSNIINNYIVSLLAFS